MSDDTAFLVPALIEVGDKAFLSLCRETVDVTECPWELQVLLPSDVCCGAVSDGVGNFQPHAPLDRLQLPLQRGKVSSISLGLCCKC